MSPCDTPQRAAEFSPQAARAAWRSVAPALAATPHVRISKDGGRTYPARHARPLPAEAPGQPCTVPAYDTGSASGRVLAIDLDPARGDVDHQAAELGQLLERLGTRYIGDVATSTGGRHLLIPFAAALPWLELRDLCRAIAARFPAVDTAPMCSLGGQISPPGSRAKRGGWRVLTMPLSEALAAVKHPNGPETWDVLLTEFAAELQQVERQRASLRSGTPDTELDDAGVPWVPRLGGRANLSPELACTARTGKWDRSRYADRSAARMAVLASAAVRGWRLADVRAAVVSGAWKGLPELYYRASEPGRMDRLLPLEWRKSVAFAAGRETYASGTQADLKLTPPAGESGADEYGLIRMWLTAVLVALEDPDRVLGWGGRVIAVRLVLLALAQAAAVSGSSVVEFGCRNLSLYCCLSHRTVARVLRMLAAEDDPLIDLVSPRRMARADRYQLRIPAMYAASARWRRRRGGRIEAVHHVFMALGATAGLVHQVLDANEARGAEVARAARLGYGQDKHETHSGRPRRA